MNLVKKSVKLFEDGFACSQAILSTYGEKYGLTKNLALKIGDPFGAGMRGLSETCGAVTGAFMVIGLKYGRMNLEDTGAKEKTTELVQEFVKRFKARHSTIICRELLGHDVSIPEERAKVEDQNLFKTVCPKFVRDAAEILEVIFES